MSKLRFFVLLALSIAPVAADEGMWLPGGFPKGEVRQKYGISVTDEFLHHLQRSSVRFNNGGSGSFISPEGLLFTNHHVGADCIQKLSSAAHDYMGNGFYAPERAKELGCPDLEVNVLLKIEDVTDRVTAAVKPVMKAAEANQARQASIGEIEKKCSQATGNRCDVVTLYSGARYHLYQYKKYTDIRLVFAPEADIAAFGGDPDNFTYPRYCLDFALFRAYEGGKPARVADYLKWSAEGAREGELMFVTGHPGSTGRLMTLAQLELARDVTYPLTVKWLESVIDTLERYSATSAEAKRAARDNLFGQQNSYKAYSGFLRGLRDPKLMDRKRSEEQALRKAIAAKPELREKYAHVWDEIAGATDEYRQFVKPYVLLEYNAIRGSDLFRIARDTLRYGEEKRKAPADRLREYRDAAIPSLEQELYSPAPLTPGMEKAVLADYFRFLQQELGKDDAVVMAILKGKSPDAAADHYVSTTKLAEPAERKRLVEDPAALRDSKDGMIELARIMDPAARHLRKRFEDKVEAVQTPGASALAMARFAVYGQGTYPDATFTFRIAYGPAIGYKTNGRPIPWATTFAGLYERATGKEPYVLPKRWREAKTRIRLSTPFDFVTTADTHGGNSGSPTVNAKGEIVGILFDGNLEGLPNRFVYNDVDERSVHVASQGIVEALRAVYHAGAILAELNLKH
jgi:hypothetical protein